MYISTKDKKIFLMIVSGLIVQLVPGFLAALDDAGSLRCDRESIMPGDTEFQVETTCGKPDSIIEKGLAQKVWIYNFGPTKFIYYLTFANGRLTRIQTGEYGSYYDDRDID